MTTTTGFVVISPSATKTTIAGERRGGGGGGSSSNNSRASDGIDMASDASLYCAQEATVEATTAAAAAAAAATTTTKIKQTTAVKPLSHGFAQQMHATTEVTKSKRAQQQQHQQQHHQQQQQHHQLTSRTKRSGMAMGGQQEITQPPPPLPRAAPRATASTPKPKPRSVLPPTTTTSAAAAAAATAATTTMQTTPLSSTAAAAAAATTRTTTQTNSQRHSEIFEPHTTPRSKQRLIKVDFSLLQDDDVFFNESRLAAIAAVAAAGGGGGGNQQQQHQTVSHGMKGVCSQPKMPPYPIGGYLLATAGDGGGSCNIVAVSEATKAAAAAAAAGVTNVQLPTTLTTRVLRRTKDNYTEDEYHRFYDNALESYDLATQCESRRASLRRHTIVGCQSNFDETHSMPPTRPESRQSHEAHGSSHIVGHDESSANRQLQHNNYNNNNNNNNGMQSQQQQQYQQQQSPRLIGHMVGIATSTNNSGSGCHHQTAMSDSDNLSCSSSSVDRPWNKSFLDEKTWQERGEDRLSLTLEEIVHIRSVMTKAELEGLPVGVRVKEDVEKRKVCFLCLRTRFSIFGPWGIQCKLCQRTVCSKCYTKMRMPTEHFRNVPLVLVSPSLLASPAGSSTPSPSHHAQQVHSSSTGNILDETFPKTLIERLLRSESERKSRNSVGSAPASPRHQRSNMSTPGLTMASIPAHQTIDEASDATAPPAMTVSYTAGTSGYTVCNNNKENKQTHQKAPLSSHFSIMSRSMEGPRSLPAVNSPVRTHSNSSTLDRKSKFSRAFTLSSSGTQLSQEQKENIRGEQVPVCHDCKGLVMEITRSSKQTRSTARNRALQNLTLDLSPVYK